ncbi:MAG: response regulator transcription factor [Oliverpabstia sp.]
MSRILIVEDDELIAALERDYLEAGGFEVKIDLNGEFAVEEVLQGGYDAVILDVMLPGKSGFDICREIRKELYLPILIVTAKKEDVDKIRGLGLGADDYLVKPFSPTELVARVRSHIQIHERLLDFREEIQKQSIQIKWLEIFPMERKVLFDGREIALTNKEYELLILLAESPGIVFSKEMLYDRIWGIDSYGDMATVTVHINRLREKIERDSASPQIIETVWGAGYRMKM